MVLEHDISRAMLLMSRYRCCLVVLVSNTQEEGDAFIERSGVLDTAVVHHVIKGTDAFNLLTAQTLNTEVPRAHLFAPPARALPPVMLAGAALSPVAVANAVDLVAEWTQEECAGAWRRTVEATRVLTRPDTQVASSRPSSAVSSAMPRAVGGGGGGGGGGSSARSSDIEDDVRITFVFGKHTCIQPCSPSLPLSQAARQVAHNWDLTLPPTARLTIGDRHEVVTLADAQKVPSRTAAGQRVHITIPTIDESPATSSVATAANVLTQSHAPAPLPAVSAPAPPSGPSDGTEIKLKYVLPDGTSHGARVEPQARLHELFAKVKSDLGHGEFVLVIAAPPPKRLTQADADSTFQQLNIGTNTMLRVVPTDGAPSSRPSSSGGPTVPNLMSRMLGGIAAWTTGRTDGSAPASSENAAPAPTPSTSGGQRHSSGGGMRTLADLRKEQEEEEKSRASNKYYGGSGTEFLGRKDGDENDGDSSRR